MERFISLSSDDQRTYCEQAAARKGLPPPTVEKDFWVCWTLRELFKSDCGKHLSFKGGTSLSKAWGLIKRFSEDIDIVIDREYLGYPSSTPTRSELDAIRHSSQREISENILPDLQDVFKSALPEASKWSLKLATEDDDPTRQTLIFEYPGVLTDQIAYLKPSVRIEMGARSDIEPNSGARIRPYLYEELESALGDGSFEVRTVAARRTLLEKTLLLHEEAVRPADRTRPGKSMARHYYDVHSLVQAGVGKEALADEGLLERIVEHRRIFFKYGWLDYDGMRRGSIVLLPRDDQIEGWKTDYNGMAKEMFFENYPEFEEVLETASEFQNEINNSQF